MKNLMMKIKQNKALCTALSILLLAIVAFLIVVPFLTFDFIKGHDIYYHLGAMRSLNQSWQDGCFGTRIYELVCQDYGYGTGLFYSMIPASIVVIFMNVFSIPLNCALSLEIFLIFFISGCIAYFFFKRIFKNNLIVTFGALSYMIFPYCLINLFERFAYSEMFIMLAIPLIAWGLYELFERDNYKSFMILFTSGYIISILTHFTLTLYITLFALIYICFNFKKLINKYYFVPFLISCVLVISITAIYYVPMLANFGTTQTSNMSGSAEGLWGTSFSIFGCHWLFPATIVSLIIIGIFTYMYFKKPKTERTKSEKTLLILSLLILFIISPLFPWFIMPKLATMIQFSWRLFAVLSIFVAIDFMYILSNTKTKFDFRAISISTLVVLSSILLNLAVIKYPNHFNNILTYQAAITNEFGLSENQAIGNPKHGDYYPEGATNEYVFNRAEEKLILDTNIEEYPSELANYQTVNQMTFLIGKSLNGYVTLNIPYSVCENIKVYQYSTNVENNKYNPSFENDAGLLKINIDNCSEECKITISYSDNGMLDKYLQENPFEFINKSGDAEAHNFVKKYTHDYTVDFTLTEKSVVELPTLYYKGYKLTYTTNDGAKEITPVLGENGFMEIELAESGTLHVQYTGGTYLKLANILSIIGISLFALTIILSLLIPRRLFTLLGDKITNYLKTHKNAGEILRFIIVGGLATIIDMLIMGIVMYAMQTNLYNSFINVFFGGGDPSTLATLVGTTVGFIAGLVFNYIASILFVFNDKGKSKTAKGFIIFTVLSVIGLLINTFGMFIGYDLIGLNQWIVKIIMTIIVLIYNYISKKLVLFKNSSNKESQSAIVDKSNTDDNNEI